jgi:hypothetical protein
MASLKIERAENGSTPDLEKIVLKVLEDTNLKFYAIIDKTFDDGKESDTFRHFYRFPNQIAKKGEFVILHSNEGINGPTGPNKEKNTAKTYHYYWGSKSCIWNDKGDTAKLIRFEDVQSIEVPPVSPPQKLSLRFK